MLIGSLILGMSAPLITKQLKHNSFTDIQAQLLNRKVENAKDDIVSNTNTIASILGGRDVATYVQYIQTLENKISVLENAVRNENIQNILNGKTELKDYDNDITGLQTQINSKASTSSVNTINTNLNNLEDDVTEIEENMKNLVPSGAVMYFDLDTCPKGWSELSSKYPNAANAFIRNLSGSGRTVGNWQQNAAPNITGGISTTDEYKYYVNENGKKDIYGAFKKEQVNSDNSIQYEVAGSRATGGSKYIFDASKSNAAYGRKDASNVAASEVRPDNIVLLACRKN